MGQHTLNIAYPIDGETLPMINSAFKIESAYFAASLSVTCSGDYNVKWGFDGGGIGEVPFYDEFSAQLMWKLPSGSHAFRVESDGGSNPAKETRLINIGPARRSRAGRFAAKSNKPK